MVLITKETTMCLIITKQSKDNCKFKYVYKLLLQHCTNKELYSFYKYDDQTKEQYHYKLNEEFVSNRKETKITKIECYGEKINIGTHVLLNKEEAVKFLELPNYNHERYYNNTLTFFNLVVVKCKAYTQNKVANGKFNGNKAAVYTKITPIKIIETIKPKGQYSFVFSENCCCVK